MVINFHNYSRRDTTSPCVVAKSLAQRVAGNWAWQVDSLSRFTNYTVSLGAADGFAGDRVGEKKFVWFGGGCGVF